MILYLYSTKHEPPKRNSEPKLTKLPPKSKEGQNSGEKKLMDKSINIR
jgi:hypothetical protein